MKKFLCYIALILLIGIIITPPLLRRFYKDEEVVVPDKYELLVCTKDSYSIASSYKNSEAINIKFKHLVDDPNLAVYSDAYALEYNLKNILNDSSQVQKEESIDNENQSMISYYLVYANANPNILNDLSDYRYSLAQQKTYYTDQGYTCSIIE